MGSGRLIAVTDTGPLIHLAEIGCLPLLSIFDELHVPDVVWDEAKEPVSIRTSLSFAVRHETPRDELDRFIRDHWLTRLQLGECAALYHCRRISVDLVLTDDLAVRDAARKLGLTPVGSLGIIVRGHRTGRLAYLDAKRLLVALQEKSSLFVTKAIVDMAIEQLRSRA